MRHRKKPTIARGKDLNRRLLRQISNSLVLHEKVETSSALAKITRSHVEKLITKGKKDTLHAKRQLFAQLSKNAARKVFEVLSPKYKDRAGGYTRLVRVPPNKDGNPRSLIEFV